MKPENYTERKKLLIRFSLLYIVSIALLSLAFVFLYGREDIPAAKAPPVSDNEGAAREMALSKANTLLGGHMDKLKRMDDSYVRLLLDSAGSSNLKEMNKSLQEEEISFGHDIDSLERLDPLYTGLAGSFRSMLADHRTIGLIRSNYSSTNSRPDEKQQDLLDARRDLLVKENRIADLERRIKDMPATAGTSGNRQLLEQMKTDNEDLQQKLDQQIKGTGVLKEQLNTLQHTNEGLNSRLNESARTAGSAADNYSSLNSKNTTLERRSAELADELRFAQVDCNLSRADARQVIYNSKQRKDLLTDALATLNELSKSGNAEVQKKAKEKLSLLRSIASTVHD